MLQSLEVSQAGEAGAAHHAVSWRRSGRDRGAGAGEEDGWVHCLLQPRDKAQKGNQVMEGSSLRVTELESDRSGPRVCAPDPHGGRGWGWRCGCCQPEAPSGGEPPGKRGPESHVTFIEKVALKKSIVYDKSYKMAEVIFQSTTKSPKYLKRTYFNQFRG